MKIIIAINCIVSIIFTICYAYQFIYVLVGMRKKKEDYTPQKLHRYAIVISARNESKVIGNLIHSINAQEYPSDCLDAFVIADNCTDDTAKIARDAGAKVYERFNTRQVGKGYALDWFFKRIKDEQIDNEYDAFIIFDADNVLDSKFVFEINKVFDKGYKIITGYRNSKNYGTNWITAGYSLWFLREARYLNHARMQLGTSCAVSGTGFLVSAEIVRKNKGWVHHLLTEDIEFTIDSVTKGEKIGYCGNAVFYDEQPTKLHQSYVQRLRWAKGFYQVFKQYGSKLIKGIFKGSFACFDMLMTIMPAMLLTLIIISINIVAVPVGFMINSPHLPILLRTLVHTIIGFYLLFFFLGAITTITEWKQIHCSSAKKILYLFTFPIFMLTYIPISIIALFRKVRWTPISHSVSKSVSEICDGKATVSR